MTYTNMQCRKRFIPFSPPDISEVEIQEVVETLRSGWITTGPRTKLFERRIAAYIETGKTNIDCESIDGIRKYSNRVVCLNSATAAEELNLRILGIGPGDEVIVPAYTYTATAAAVIHVGATIKFVDSIPNSFEMDYDQLENAITERTKAVVPVDVGGVLCDYKKIYQILEKKKYLFNPSGCTNLGYRIQKKLKRVAIIADSAHAFGSKRYDKMSGAIADFSSFSFHAVKNLTTAEGGAATWRKIAGIDDEEIYHQYQLYSLHGQSKDALAKTKLGSWEYDVVGPWYKCNMTDIMAAIGIKQLDRYENLIEKRHSVISKYNIMCDDLEIQYLAHAGTDFKSSGHLYLVRVPGITSEDRNEIIRRLAEQGVTTNVHYKPLPMLSAYRTLGWNIKDFPNAYDYFHNLITLPLHTQLLDEDIEYVTDCFRKVVMEYI